MDYLQLGRFIGLILFFPFFLIVPPVSAGHACQRFEVFFPLIPLFFHLLTLGGVGTLFSGSFQLGLFFLQKATRFAPWGAYWTFSVSALVLTPPYSVAIFLVGAFYLGWDVQPFAAPRCSFSGLGFREVIWDFFPFAKNPQLVPPKIPSLSFF